MKSRYSTKPNQSMAIAEKLKEYRSLHYQANRFAGVSTEVRRLLFEDPFALLVGSSFNRGLCAESVWKIPYYIRQQGMLDPHKLSAASLVEMNQLLRFLPVTPRYGPIEGARTLNTAVKLVMKHGGDAAAIWQHVSPKQVVRRLQTIHGVGPKIANMHCRILYDNFGLFRGQEHEIDVAADIHLQRVFTRTGLISFEDKDLAIYAAQQLNPEFPGALDWPAFFIGTRWCHKNRPDCANCPLTAVCRKRLD